MRIDFWTDGDPAFGIAKNQTTIELELDGIDDDETTFFIARAMDELKSALGRIWENQIVHAKVDRENNSLESEVKALKELIYQLVGNSSGQQQQLEILASHVSTLVQEIEGVDEKLTNQIKQTQLVTKAVERVLNKRLPRFDIAI